MSAADQYNTNAGIARVLELSLCGVEDPTQLLSVLDNNAPLPIWDNDHVLSFASLSANPFRKVENAEAPARDQVRLG